MHRVLGSTMTSRDSFSHIVWLPLVTILATCGVICIPPPPLLDAHYPLTEGHVEGLEEEVHHRVKRAAINTTAYKYYWISQCGYSKERPANIPSLEVAATHKTSDEGHLLAAKLMHRMTRFMPLYIFKPLAEKGSVGIFSVTEVVGDFPEFANRKNTPECGDSCGDFCRRTCTADGRKIDSLLGYGGTRAVVREDNLLCQEDDPYRGTFNVLSHEFAHTIDFKALNANHSLLIRQSYSTAGVKWQPNTYATSNRREYFAEAVTSYFLTSLTSPRTSGGMNRCGNSFCTDEWASRKNLKEKDREIYDLVDEIFTNHRVYLEGRVGICDWR